MENKLRVVASVLIIGFISLNMNAQSNKSFTPTKGEIAFRKVTKVTDQKLFYESLGDLKEKLKKSLEESVSEEDSAGREQEIQYIITQSSNMMGVMLFPESSSHTYHHKFADFKIIRFISSDNKVIGDYEVIDSNKATYTFLAKKDSLTTYSGRMHPYSTNIIVKTTEDKKNRKTINGYDCYKVTYEYKEGSEEEDFPNFMKDMIFKREMWVTDKIKTLFHPVLFEKSILEKYYPLHILETQNGVEGFETTFTVEKITLQ